MSGDGTANLQVRRLVGLWSALIGIVVVCAPSNVDGASLIVAEYVTGTCGERLQRDLQVPPSYDACSWTTIGLVTPNGGCSAADSGQDGGLIEGD